MSIETLSTVRTFFETQKILEQKAKNYSEWKMVKAKAVGTNHLDRKELKEKALLAMEEIYYSYSNSTNRQRAVTAWGDDGHVFENLLMQAKPEIEKAKEKAKNGSAGGALSIIEKVKTAFLMSRKIKGLLPEQRVRMFEAAGYDALESVDLCKKLGISLTLTAAEYSLLGVALYASSGSAALSPFLPELPDVWTTQFLAATYGFKYITLLINSYFNAKLLENEKINNSPNVFSTGSYFLLRKLLPDKENVQRWGATLASSITPVSTDVIWAPAMLVPVVGPSMIAARNLAGGTFYTMETVAKQWWLKKKGRP